jgi:hypothetical protein
MIEVDFWRSSAAACFEIIMELSRALSMARKSRRSTPYRLPEEDRPTDEVRALII